jgi:hypothetical protein
MNYNQIIKFKYNKTQISNSLIPCSDLILDDQFLEDHQICTIYMYEDNYYFITPFFVHVPYAESFLWNNESREYDIELCFMRSCYYTRLSLFVLKNREDQCKLINWIKLSDQLLDLSNIENPKIISIDETIINIPNINISFKNIVNEQLKPYNFIWLEVIIVLQDLEDHMIPGTAVLSNDRIIGIVFNYVDNMINIIPMISIYRLINGFRYSNVFFNYVIDEDIKIAKICSSTVNLQQQQKLKNDDLLIKINDEFINKDGSVMLPKCNINVPLHVYIFYCEYRYKRSIIFHIERDDEPYNIKINTQDFVERLTIKNSYKTKFEKNNDSRILYHPNLLLFEWLIANDINFKSEIYLEHKLNPLIINNKKHNRNKKNYMISIDGIINNYIVN